MVISIEISDSNINIIKTSKKGELLSILDCITINISSGIKDDKISDINYLSNIISKALKINNIKTKKAVFVINSNSIITRKIKLPVLSKKQETMSMLKYELGQLLPVDLNRYQFIYKIIEPLKENNNAFYVIYCLPLDLLNQYYELAKILKFKSVIFDVSCNCLNKIYTHNLCINGAYIKKDVTAFVEISSNKIFFCVINQGVNDFSMTTIINPEHNNELTAEAQALYTINNLQDYDDFVYNVLDEISKYIRYYHSISNEIKIRNIHIYGSSRNLEDISQIIEMNLNIDSSVLKNISNIEFINNKAQKGFNINIFFTLLLAAFNDKRDIYFKQEKDNILNIKNNYVIIITIAILLFFVLNFYVIYKLNEINSMKQYVTYRENIVLNNEIEEVKKEITRLENLLHDVEQLKATAVMDDFVCSDILREIKNAKPKNTLVTSISVDSNSTILNCTSDSMEEVTLFLCNLRNIEIIDSVYMPGVEVIQDYKGKYSYSVACVIKEVVVIGK
jgi:type IV pilus assembly protein PilM